LYERVTTIPADDIDPALVRAALRRGAAVEFLRGEPVSYLRRHLDLCRELPAPTRALAEHALIDALVACGRYEGARLVLHASSVEVDDLPGLDRMERARICLELGIESDPRHLAELAAADEAPVESILSTLLDAAGERDTSEAGGIYDSLAIVIRRACEVQASRVPAKSLVRCAQRYERASRPEDAAACWHLIWLRRQDRRGENDPKTLAALKHFRRLSAQSDSQSPISGPTERLRALAWHVSSWRGSKR
jgi:hypothetical protein